MQDLGRSQMALLTSSLGTVAFLAKLMFDFSLFIFLSPSSLLQTIWDGATYKVTLEFPEEYPDKPPKCRFIKVYQEKHKCKFNLNILQRDSIIQIYIHQVRLCKLQTTVMVCNRLICPKDEHLTIITIMWD